MGGIAVVNVALASLGGTAGVGKILVEVIAEVAAPKQVAAEPAMGEGNDVDRLVRQQRERDDQALVALAAGDGALDQSLSVEFEDPVIRGPAEVHPRINSQQRLGRRGF